MARARRRTSPGRTPCPKRASSSGCPQTPPGYTNAKVRSMRVRCGPFSVSQPSCLLQLVQLMIAKSTSGTLRRMKKFWPVLGMLAFAACGSKGCSCTQPIKGGYPIAERHEGALQIRATESLFQFLSQNGATIIPKLLPGGTVFNVPPQCSAPGGTKICCATPAPMCRLQLDFKALSL